MFFNQKYISVAESSTKRSCTTGMVYYLDPTVHPEKPQPLPFTLVLPISAIATMSSISFDHGSVMSSSQSKSRSKRESTIVCPQDDGTIVTFFVNQHRLAATNDSPIWTNIVSTTVSSEGTDYASSVGSMPNTSLDPIICNRLREWNDAGGNIGELKVLKDSLRSKAVSQGEIGSRKNWPNRLHTVPAGVNIVEAFKTADPEGLENNLANVVSLNDFLSLDGRPEKYEYLHRKLLITGHCLSSSSEHGNELEFWAGLVDHLIDEMEKR